MMKRISTNFKWRRRALLSALTGMGVVLLGVGPRSGLTNDASTPPWGKLTQVDGGVDYYQRFANPLPVGPTFFPIGVWFESVVDSLSAVNKDVGVNIFVVVTADSRLEIIKNSGMFAILQQSEFAGNESALANSSVVGWELHDEIDMQVDISEVDARLQNIRGRLPEDGRLRYNNYGKGVVFWLNDDDAARLVNSYQDIVSADTYWFTDPDIAGAWQGGKLLNNGRPLTESQTRRAANYGYTVDRLRGLDDMDGTRRPVWSFVELGWPSDVEPEKGGRAIKPAEMNAAVWHSIIAGARGIIYFNHSFGGPYLSQHLLRDPNYLDIRAAVRDTNARIAQLAPVLNAPFVLDYAKCDAGIRSMAKYYDGRYYIFSGNTENETREASCTVAGPANGVAKLIGEDRSVQIVNGTFTDKFEDGNTIHIYQIEP
ncbi:hypothetical protein G5V57_31460 [Nordella sp. HKS 07]|uniref:hypothetical protein n=1 Tax=Nordella sp. HKS 07 TaxID=2712222 RepID=UPI0013E17D34|nr:hypothetical protein [Nordella sp. HKS 07]QIG51829.1 hypothetical protein G5V57_31460 [Nordella sp. HKS 07]